MLDEPLLVCKDTGPSEDIRDRLRQSEALLAISNTVSSTLDLGEALRRICRELTRLLGADSGAVYLHDVATDQLAAVAGYRVPKELAAMLPTVGLPLREQGFYVPLWRERRPIFSDDVAADPRFSHELFRLVRHRSGLLVPLVLADTVAGAFYLVWWTARRQVTERELVLVDEVVTLVATLLRNAGLLDRAERERRHLETMYEIARRLAAVHDTAALLSLLVNEASGLLGAEAAGIRLIEGDHLVVGARTESAAPLMTRARIKVGESLSGQIVATGEPVAVEDLVDDTRYDTAHKHGALERGFHGFLGVPLRLHGSVIGTLNVYTKARRRFRSDEVSLLSALADQASLAIDKARLLRQAEAREQEATKLYALTSQLASSLDLDEILDHVTNNTVNLLDADAAGIYVDDEAQGGLIFRRGLNLDSRLVSDLVLKPGEGVAGRAYQEQRPVWTCDRLADPSLGYSLASEELIRAAAPRAYLAAPIVIRGTVHGVLMAYFFQPHEFRAKEIQLLSTLADHAAIAMDNAWHYEAMRTEQMRLAQIFASTSDGIVLVGRTGHIEAANRRAGELLDVDPDDVVGRELGELLAGSQTATADEERTIAGLRSLVAEPDREAQGDLELRSKQRVLHWVSQPTRSTSGATVGVTLTFRDVTQEREVSQMKSDFVSFVTHQLRTPLAGIKWMLELAGQEAGVPPDAGSYVQDARQAALRLIGLVNDLLDISRLERGKLTIEAQPIELGELTQSVLDETGLLLEERGHRLSVSGNGEVPLVRADPQLLRQVMLNLVSNAIKYTPRGGSITVRLEPDDEHVRWSISDTGIGIPRPAQARLFEKFYRADNVVAIETEGTGLGLYLVRLIVEQLGGRVWCESLEGSGSTFTFTLPSAR